MTIQYTQRIYNNILLWDPGDIKMLIQSESGGRSQNYGFLWWGSLNYMSLISLFFFLLCPPIMPLSPTNALINCLWRGGGSIIWSDYICVFIYVTPFYFPTSHNLCLSYFPQVVFKYFSMWYKWYKNIRTLFFHLVDDTLLNINEMNKVDKIKTFYVKTICNLFFQNNISKDWSKTWHCFSRLKGQQYIRLKGSVWCQTKRVSLVSV